MKLLSDPIRLLMLFALLMPFILIIVMMLQRLMQPRKPEPASTIYIPSDPSPRAPTPKHTPKPRHAEVVDSLNWLMEHQIISPYEYNQIMVKSLPFLDTTTTIK